MNKQKVAGQLEDRLREYRYKRGWTQKLFALNARLSVATIKRAEAGIPLSPQTLYRLEEILNREAA